MPELPEVEVLIRHLRPLVQGRTIRAVTVYRDRVIAPSTARQITQALRGARITDLTRRGKYLVFQLRSARSGRPFTMLGHLGMTGRMFVARRTRPLPKHAAVVLEFGRDRFIYEDQRYFGRLTLDAAALERLGPEPLSDEFRAEDFGRLLKSFSRAIKVKLLDQDLIAGVGNIYASEALFRARISPRLAAHRLTLGQVRRLHRAIREVLALAIRQGSTIPLSFAGDHRDGLFYFGQAPGTPDFYAERLRVYDRQGQPCPRCAAPIRRIVQAARSTFFCPACQAPAKRLR